MQPTRGTRGTTRRTRKAPWDPSSPNVVTRSASNSATEAFEKIEDSQTAGTDQFPQREMEASRSTEPSARTSTPVRQSPLVGTSEVATPLRSPIRGTITPRRRESATMKREVIGEADDKASSQCDSPNEQEVEQEVLNPARQLREVIALEAVAKGLQGCKGPSPLPHMDCG